jgi:hypothetical protein
LKTAWCWGHRSARAPCSEVVLDRISQ